MAGNLWLVDLWLVDLSPVRSLIASYVGAAAAPALTSRAHRATTDRVRGVLPRGSSTGSTVQQRHADILCFDKCTGDRLTAEARIHPHLA